MAAVVCQRGRSRIWAFSPASGAPPAAGTTGSVSGLTDPSSRTFVASMESTDFANGVMAWAPSANTVQISAESVQDLRLHRACCNPVRRALSGCLGPPGPAGLNGTFPGSTTEFVVRAGDAAWVGRSLHCVVASKMTGVDAVLRIPGTREVLGGRLVAHLEAVEKRPGEQHPHRTLQRPGEHQWEPESRDGGHAPGHQCTNRGSAPDDATPGAADPSHEIGRGEPLAERDGDDGPCADRQTDHGEGRAGQFPAAGRRHDQVADTRDERGADQGLAVPETADQPVCPQAPDQSPRRAGRQEEPVRALARPPIPSSPAAPGCRPPCPGDRPGSPP